MIRKTRSLALSSSLSLALVLLAPVSAAAQNQVEVYRIPALAVDVTAGTAAQARDRAIREVQRRALDRLWARLVDQEAIPLIPVLDDAAVAGLVAGLEFRNERYSARRYIADVSVTFGRNQVRQILDTTGVPYSEAVARPLLVVPVLMQPDGTLAIWDNNDFAAAWADYGWDGNLVPFILPQGSGYERAMLGPVQVQIFDRESFLQLMDVYDTSDAALVLGQPFYGLPGTPAMDVVVRRVSDPENMPGLVYRFGDLSGAVAAGPDPTDTLKQPSLEPLLSDASEAMGYALTADWRRTTQVQGGQPSSLLANIPINSLSDWLNAERRLRSVGLIRGMDVASLNVRLAQVRLNFLGNVEQLTLSLGEAGIDLTDQAGNWVLYFR